MKLCTGLAHPETPVALDGDRWLLVECDEPRRCVSIVEPDGSVVTVARTGRPNGVARDRRGDYWVCETAELDGRPGAGLVRIGRDGETEVVVRDWQGEPLSLPNDLVFGPDGRLYFTDTGFSVTELLAAESPEAWWRARPKQGALYRLDIESRELERLDSGLDHADGIVWGAAAREFFVGEMRNGNIRRYVLDATGNIDRCEVVANAFGSETPSGLVGPDGMAVAANGDVYIAMYNQGRVVVIDAAGRAKTPILTEGGSPSNCALKNGRLYVTEVAVGQIEVFEVGVAPAATFA
jgi:gluconolactonase